MRGKRIKMRDRRKEGTPAKRQGSITAISSQEEYKIIAGWFRPFNLAAVGKPETVRLRGRIHPAFLFPPNPLARECSGAVGAMPRCYQLELLFFDEDQIRSANF